MNWIDIIILLPLLVGLVRGLMRGLVTEFIAIMAVILGCVGAKMWGPQFAHWLLAQFTWPERICEVVSYALLFLGITLALNIVGRLFSRLLSAIHLGWANRLLGGVFGAAKYAVIVLTLVFLVDKLDQQFHFINSNLKHSSMTYRPAVQSANTLLREIETHAGTVIPGK